MARLILPRSLFPRTLIVLLAGAAAVASPLSDSKFETLVDQYCLACHNSFDQEGNLDLDGVLARDVIESSDVWEKVIRKLAARQMPPPGEERPSDAEYETLSNYLIARLDAAAAKRPRPGRVETFRRLNRTEYQNAVGDLLAVEIDASELLPADESSHGFDHITVGDLPPGLLARWTRPRGCSNSAWRGGARSTTAGASPRR